MQTKVSIIIPVFNVEKYIESCLASVVRQTFREGMECILIDDCGTDCSMDIADSFIENYKGNVVFKILHNSKNSGPSFARNAGIREAKGDYVFFLDSDDEITDHCVEMLYSFVTKYQNVQLVQGTYLHDKGNPFCNFLPYTEDKRKIKSCLLTYNGKNLVPHNRLVMRNFILTHDLFFKEGIIHEDNLWVYYLAKHVESMAYCPECTYNHRYNPRSITGNINISKEIIAYRTIIEDASAHIDSFFPCYQKEFILNNLLTAINNHYYENLTERKKIKKIFANKNSMMERLLLHFVFSTGKGGLHTILLHLLIRLYKFNDRRL